MLSAGTTCCIAATKALQHLEDNLAAITNIFTAYQIPSSDYRLLAGFDEEFIKIRTGHLEQIHVLLYSEPRYIRSMLRRLELIFSPFSAIIFTKGAVHRLPMTNTAFRKIDWDDFSDFLNTRRWPGRQRYPTAVSLSHITKERASPNGNQAEGGRESDSPDGEGANPVEISFLATSDLHPLEPRSECPYQSLTTKGTFVITRTPESRQHSQLERFATCQVFFTELGTGSAGNSAYAHFHTKVIVDSQQELTHIRNIKPRILLRFSDSQQVPEYSASPETTFICSRGMGGLVIWEYDVIDGVGEKVMASDKLPQAKFEFIEIDTPAPPPDRIDFEVATYWSVLPRDGGSENSQIWNSPTGFWSNKPSYSNIYQLVTLKVPSDVPREHYDFQARHTVFPRLPTDVVHSTVLDAKLGFDSASSVYDVKRRDKVLRLTSFRKVGIPPMATCKQD